MGHFLRHCRRRSSTSACGVQRALQLASHLAALQSPLAPRPHRRTQPTVQMTSATLLTASRRECFSSPTCYWHFVTHSLCRLQTNTASPLSEAATPLGIHGRRLPVGAQTLELWASSWSKRPRVHHTGARKVGIRWKKSCSCDGLPSPRTASWI